MKRRDDEAAQAPLEQAIAEFLIAEDSGETFDIALWLAKRPEIADELVRFLEDHYRARAALKLNGTGSFYLQDTLQFRTSLLVNENDADPTAIAGYRLIRLLGQGGMGRVYEAVDAHDHHCAIKLLAPQWNEHEQAMERFKQEGVIASSINHPRCVFVQTADEDQGQPYIIMELMSGKTLRDLVVQQGPLSVAQAVPMIIDVIDGLQAAHDLGMIHRDVKPANCYLESSGRVKIGDFGLSRSLESDSQLTRTGNVVGTPLYASPEQLRSEDLDFRTDIYSLSATLHYLLTGKAPFEHSNATIVIARISSEAPPALRSIRPEIPKEIEQVVLRGLYRNRDKRPKNLAEIREALEPFLPKSHKIKTLGLRFAAYMIDGFFICVWTILIAIASMRLQSVVAEYPAYRPALWEYLVMIFPQWIYFFACEWLWGASIGKYMLRIRVCNSGYHRRPGFLQCLVRTSCWWLLNGVAVDIALYFWLPDATLLQWLAFELGDSLVFGLVNLSPLVLTRDQRLLHDIISATSVRLASEIKARSPHEGVRTDVQLQPVAETWKQIGRFEIQGILSTNGEAHWLFGKDPRLNRNAWILMRPNAARPVPPERRSCSRPGRLRWIGCGLHEPYRWDAFLAPRGKPITDRKATQSGDWGLARSVLLHLAEEIEASDKDGLSLPPLDPASVLVDRWGGTVWIDEPATTSATSHDQETPENRLAFLDRIATALLRPVKQDSSSLAMSCSHIPVHAKQILDRLSRSNSIGIYKSIPQLIESLRSVQDRPSRVTLSMRSMQAMILLALGVIPFAILLVLNGTGEVLRMRSVESEILKLRALEHIASDVSLFQALGIPGTANSKDSIANRTYALERVRTRLAFLEAVRHRPRTAFHLVDDVARQQMGDIPMNDWLLSHLMAKIHADEPFEFEWMLPDAMPKTKSTPVQPGQEWIPITATNRKRFAARTTYDAASLIHVLESTASGPTDVPVSNSDRQLTLAWLAVPLILAGLWSALWRGGLAAGLAGIVIVRRDGSAPSRLVHFFRGAGLWFPWALIFFAVVAIPIYSFAHDDLTFWLRRLFAVGPILYLIIALIFRTRGPHDYLFGTVLVPK